MNKKMTALFCLFLTLLFVLAACRKHSPYGTVVVDQQGMEHVVMTDANGVTVVNGEGNLVEVVTDSDSRKPITVPTENGTNAEGLKNEYQTHAVTFPGIVEKGKTVEDGFCSVELPKGWEQIGNNTLILRHKETDARISIYADLEGTYNEALEQMQSDLEKLPEGIEAQNTTVEIDGVPGQRTQYDLGSVTQITYLLQVGGGRVCRINCTVDANKQSAVDIDALVQTIHLK